MPLDPIAPARPAVGAAGSAEVRGLELARHHPAPERRLLRAGFELGAIPAQVEHLGIPRDLLLLQEGVLLRLLHELREPAAGARRLVGRLLEIAAVPALDLLLHHVSGEPRTARRRWRIA